MSFEIRPFVRENEHVLIALAGPSGGGKTKSAIRLARGLAEGGKIGLIDSEMGRARHYADGDTSIIYGRLSPPFAPDAYMAAVAEVAKAGATVIIVDSMSHEWQGEGGVLEWQEAELDRMAGKDWDKRERVKFTAWIKPKTMHKKMMGRFLQCPAHLIFCLRAEEKVKPGKDPQTGKTIVIPLGWVPICEKNFMYEMTASFVLSDTKDHLPTPIKLQDQHRPMFPLDRPISEECGIALAKWARGGVVDTGAGAVGKPSKSPDGDVQSVTPVPDDAQAIYDEIVAFARSTDDAAGLREVWTTDTRAGWLKGTNDVLYKQAKRIVLDRLKELETA